MKEFDRIIETLEHISAELERLVVLKEYELGVRVENAEGGHGPYVAKVEE
jgi:exonuclease VII small subunit